MDREQLKEMLIGMGIEILDRDGIEVIRLKDLLKAVIPADAEEEGDSLEMDEMSDTEKNLELSEEERLDLAEDIADETPGLNLDFSDNSNLDML